MFMAPALLLVYAMLWLILPSIAASGQTWDTSPFCPQATGVEIEQSASFWPPGVTYTCPGLEAGTTEITLRPWSPESDGHFWTAGWVVASVITLGVWALLRRPYATGAPFQLAPARTSASDISDSVSD